MTISIYRASPVDDIISTGQAERAVLLTEIKTERLLSVINGYSNGRQPVLTDINRYYLPLTIY
jgi:hypothetical protein